MHTYLIHTHNLTHISETHVLQIRTHKKSKPNTQAGKHSQTHKTHTHTYTHTYNTIAHITRDIFTNSDTHTHKPIYTHIRTNTKHKLTARDREREKVLRGRWPRKYTQSHTQTHRVHHRPSPQPDAWAGVVCRPYTS